MGIAGLIIAIVSIIGCIVSAAVFQSAYAIVIAFVFAAVAIVGIVISAIGIKKGPKAAGIIGLILSIIALVGGIGVGCLRTFTVVVSGIANSEEFSQAFDEAMGELESMISDKADQSFQEVPEAIENVIGEIQSELLNDN